MLPWVEYTIATDSQRTLDELYERYEGIQAYSSHALVDFRGIVATEAFQGRQFDVVVAVDTGLSKFKANEVLANMKGLLKPQGKVCIVEANNPGLHLSLAAGISRTHGMRSANDQTDEGWRSAFRDHAFEVEIHMHDFEHRLPQQLCMTIASGASEPEVSLPPEITLLEATHPSPQAVVIAGRLAAMLAESGDVLVKRQCWNPSTTSTLHGGSYISLLELDQPFLYDLSKNEFEMMQRLLLDSRDLLWVNGTGGPSDALVAGMFRSVRNEIPGIRLRALQVDLVSAFATTAALIYKVAGYKHPDEEFRVIGGVVNSCRIEEAPSLNESVAALAPRQKHEVRMMLRTELPVPVKLAVHNPGMLDSLYYEPDHLPGTPLESGQVEINVQASGMNFREVMYALGLLPDTKMGFDCAGYVHRVAADVRKFKIGDRVVALHHGAHRTMHRVPACLCNLIPEAMSFEQASTIPLVHCTAWYGLAKLAQARPGQSILIHAAAGGVGQAAIMLAQHFKLEIFATVGSEEKATLLKRRYDIPEDHIFNSRDLSFAKGIKRITNGHGVDVILNSLSGEALRQTWHCIAPFGTFLEIGLKDTLGNSRLDMAPFRQDITFSFFDINHLATEKPELMSTVLTNVFDLFARGILQPVSPLTAYPASEVESAFRQMQTGKHLGKITISYSDNGVLPVAGFSAHTVSLDDSGAYLLVGGLGGAGRSLAMLLARLGAKRLCILSRSGARSPHAAKQSQKLAALGVRAVVYECDVADATSLRRSLQRCTAELGPVRGVIQGAMSLHDNLFETTTHEQWTESLKPKVQGTWNLHEILPKDIDFFVILSSFAGVFGNRGQSSYAAANAYQDALAHHRRGLGLRAVAIDLGILRDVGVLAEIGITENLRQWEEPFGIREFELHALVERAIASQLSSDDSVPAQLLTGMASAGEALAAKIDMPFYLGDPRFCILARTGLSGHASDSSSGPRSDTIQSRLSASLSLAEATEVVVEAIVSRLATMLQTLSSEIDKARPLHTYGLDSLVAVELGHWVHKELQSNASVFDLMSSAPITALGEKIALRSSALPPGLRSP